MFVFYFIPKTGKEKFLLAEIPTRILYAKVKVWLCAENFKYLGIPVLFLKTPKTAKIYI